MKKFTLLLTTLIAFSFVNAQVLQENYWKNFKPRSIGPAGMSGRVTAIDVVEAKPEVIYAGTASGGLWRSTDGGIDWKPLFDDEKVISIGAVAVQQTNPDVIWAGTGEGNPRNSHTSGFGIYKSIDGGKTWRCMGLENTRTIHRIIIHRDNPNVVFAATLGSAWGPTEDRGVYKTTDGGKTWKKVLYNNQLTGCADLVVDAQNPNKLIAAMWEHQRWPWFFKSGGEGSGLYISFDAGETWQKKTEKDGLPKDEIGRIGLAISPSKPNVVYALVESKKTALYRSNDGGFKWNKVADKNIGNRPFYYADIYVDPQNENRLFNLFSLVTKSEDGGKTFEVIMPYSGYHPDHHAFYIHPTNNNFMINGNDGGMNISRDGGKTWRFVENLPLAQFYHINLDNDIPYNVYGGMQDNGSWVGPAYVWKNDGIRNSYWNEVLFGDGFDVMPDPENNRFGFAMYQGGNIYRFDKQTGQNHYIQPLHPDDEKLRFHWNAAMAQDPFNKKGLYFGSQFVHKSEDQGKSWEIISTDLTTNNPEKQKQAESGGLTIDATKAENHTTIIAIEPSSLNKEVIWVGTDDGNIQLTQDGGKTWKNLSPSIKAMPKEAWIPQIRASKYDEAEAFVVVNNYRQNDWKPYLFYTKDFGKTWKNLVSENQVFGHCLSVIQDIKEPNLLFLGTENGLYTSFDKGLNWEKWGKGYPNVATRDMQIQDRESDLVTGTFGRAAFVFDNIAPFRFIAKNGIDNLGNLKTFDTPDAYLAYRGQPDGLRFGADATFAGDNKRSGAMISYWWMPTNAEKDVEEKDIDDKNIEEDDEEAENENSEKSNEKKDKKKSSKKIGVYIFNEDGDTIRNYTIKPDSGFNRTYWNLRANGVNFPSYSSPIKDADKPSGNKVKPGKYKIILVKDDFKDSTSVTVKPDPRVPFSAEAYNQKEKLNNQLQGYTKAAFDLVTNLNDASKRIGMVNQNIELLEDSIQAKIKKQGKTCQDSINKYYLFFMTAKDFEGYDHVTVRINNLLGSAGEYINWPTDYPGPQAEIALKNVERELQKAAKSINKFFEANWKNYQDLVKQSEPKLFKEYKPVKLSDD